MSGLTGTLETTPALTASLPDSTPVLTVGAEVTSTGTLNPFEWMLNNATTAQVPASIHGKSQVVDVTCRLDNGEQFLPDQLGIDPVSKTVFFTSQMPVSGRLIIV